MKMPRREGLLRITQLISNPKNSDVCVRDLPADEWSYRWFDRSGVTVLRLEHDNADDNLESFEFIEFSAPVQIEFIAEH